jgi:hypothetical protein
MPRYVYSCMSHISRAFLFWGNGLRYINSKYRSLIDDKNIAISHVSS